MSAIDDIVAQLPMASLAGQVGSDPQTTETAVRQVLPALLGGLHANAQDPAGASSLAGALGQHSPELVEGGVNLDQVDTGEGSKIVSNIFGGQTDQVAQTLGGSLGGETGLVQKLLPILAPIVLSYLAQRLGGQNQATQQGAEFNVRYRLLKPDDTCRWVAAGGVPSFGLLGDAFAGYLGTITELAEGATDTIRAYGKVERFRPPAPYQTTTPASALDRVADHLIMAHSLIEDDGGKRALPDLRKALFKIGQALAAQATERERLN